jgi:hypothetical protein
MDVNVINIGFISGYVLHEETAGLGNVFNQVERYTRFGKAFEDQQESK